MNNDIFDNGKTKYTSATEIYDGLCLVEQSEEISILSDMFSDISYDGQDYYYIDTASKLKEKFEELSEYLNKMYLLDLAVWQLDDCEIHDLVYEAMYDPELSKRLGFKKLFIDIMMNGYAPDYDEIIDASLDEIQELDRFDYYEINGIFCDALRERGRTIYISPYNDFCNALHKKANGIRLEDERTLIYQCRTLLNSYDDFILGLRANQELYTRLEQQFQSKTAQLQAAYECKLREIMALAEGQGVLLDLPTGSSLPVIANE